MPSRAPGALARVVGRLRDLVEHALSSASWSISGSRQGPERGGRRGGKKGDSGRYPSRVVSSWLPSSGLPSFGGLALVEMPQL